MGCASWKHFAVIATIFLLSCLEMQGQNTDCLTAQIICSDGPITFRPNGSGINDFENPKNIPGCLKGDFDGNTIENQSAWYYFEFREDMPPNSVIEFTISPGIIPGEVIPDYDFAIFGPNVKCDSLGSPRRCSFAVETCDFCPETGLGKGATDESESARGSDGFVAPMIVQPGEGFYLMLDNFNFNGTQTVFTLTWGGSAAPYLNCLANPICGSKTVDAGDDMQFCQNPAPFKLNASVKNVTSRVEYKWVGTIQALNFLSSTTELQPTVTIPANFSGSLDYILTITDGDCVTADAVAINVASVTPAQLRADTLICQGESTTISLPTVYQSYQWSNGATTPTITVSSGGTYSVTVSNGGSCFSTDDIFITLRELPKPIVEGGEKICSDEFLTLNTNIPFSTYFWSNGRTTPTTTIDRGGNYSVTVTDAFGCRGTGSLTVTEFPNPAPEISGVTAFCEGQSTTLSTTIPYNSYLWSSGESTSNISKNVSGLFTVTVTDVNGCRGIDSAAITRNDLPTLTLNGNPAFCENSSTQLTTITNATQITWSNGATIPSISINTPGNYSVTVTNTQGCQKKDTIEIRQQPIPQPFITDSITICPETSATLETQSNFISYRWSNGATTPTIKVSQAGDYRVEVTDSVGCIGNATLTVDVFPVIPPPDITGVQNFCPDQGTTLTANGNYAGYIWSNGDTTAATQVFATDTYTVTVRDANGCVSQDSISVQAFQVTAPISDTVSFCTGDSATIHAGGNYSTYRWSTGSSQSSIQVTSAGVYELTVTDSNNCESSAIYEAQENAVPQFSVQGSDRFCNGGSTLLSVPTGFQSYRWSNGDTTSSITVQVANNYSITVTDINGCNGTNSISVTVLPLPTPSIGGTIKLCENEQGTLTISPSFPQYIWSNGSQQATLNIMQGGTYAVTVTDANNCQGSASIDVSSFQNPTVIISTDTLICEGANTIASATKGFSAYEWSNGSTHDSIIINTAGNYSVTVTDNNGCKASDAKRITQIDAPIANAGPNQNLDCDTKSVQLGTTNGQNNYRFLWEGPAINTSNENLQQPTVNQAGIYRLLITDTVSGCQSQLATVEIIDLTYTPQITLQLQDTLDCNTNSVTINASGSHQGSSISYQWYNARREVLGRNLTLNTSQEGLYYFEIKDANTSCNAIDSIRVIADLDPAFVEAGIPDTLDCNTSIAILNGSTSSTADHILYQWTAPNGTRISNQLRAEVDQPGWYILTITNAKNGCSNRDSVEIKLDRTLPTVSAGADQILDCNATTAALQGTVVVNGYPISYSWASNNNFVFENPNQLLQTINQPGIYILEAKNLQNGCVAKDSVTVVDDSDIPTQLDLEVVDPTCFGAKNGQIRIKSVTGGEGPYFFSLNGSTLEFVEQFANLGAGNYKIKVEDVAGCSYETEVLLEEGIKLKVDLGRDTSVKLGQQLVLEAFVNVPTQSITKLEWGGNLLEPCWDSCWLLTVLPKQTETYTVTVTNNVGCQATDDIVVQVDRSKGIYIPNAFSPNGDGYNDIFMIYTGNELTTIKSLQIMNRWGSRVFEAEDFRPNDPAQGWDGRSKNGTPFNPGVFAYILTYVIIIEEDGKEKEETIMLKGDITLVK